ncbi:hypothetical protein Vretimale_10731 [Volvox reticuliferus]|uniref:SMP-LTD domain-containing protein n=1 Tax=Volvox reticuliferus TaxID=1737510 RepID=A0A8J4CPW1_9CHLO|nr:hypothetical protein Vretifemale_13832 [Volvox reticuliferus]GIM06488.1 hypothetical protein Vretimale_10731 [Volvox reticuliferus]
MAALMLETPQEVRKLADAPTPAAVLDLHAATAASISAAAAGLTQEVKRAAEEDIPVERGSSYLPEESKMAGHVNVKPSAGRPNDEIFGDFPESNAIGEVAEALPAAAIVAPVSTEAGGAAEVMHNPVETVAVASKVSEIQFERAEPPPESSPMSQATTASAATSAGRDDHQEAVDSEIHAAPKPTAVPAVDETTAGDSPAMPEVAAGSVNMKKLQHIAAEAAKQAGQAYFEAGNQARVTLKDLLSLREKEGPPVTLTVDQIATAAFFVLIGLHLIILPIFLPSTFRLLYSLLLGLLVGFGISFLFFHNNKKKAEVNELLGIDLGLKGVQLVAGGVPAMFNVSDTEKMEWLNALIKEVWPFVDKGVCNMIKDITAQTMPGVLASLPSVLSGTVKSVGFKHLTFGAMPFRVESIGVHGDRNNGLILELSIKWCGDPNITLAIEIPGGQKLCPRVLDISFAATLRVVLRPLVPRLPGFVALMATVPKPPLIKYRLDFGKAMGGAVAPMAVTPVVNYFLRNVLDRMLVWPNRIVVPILQEIPQDAAEVQKLMRRVRGMLRICVANGKQLKGVNPTDSAIVELTADSEYFESTPPRAAVSPEEWKAADGKVKLLSNTEIVTWRHYIYLLVQEPESQMLRLEAFDLTEGRASHGAITGRRSIGRALVKLGRLCKAGMEGSHVEQSVRVQLGENDWGSPGGPGKGAGSIMLAVSYFPCEDFTQEQILTAKKGIITFRLLAIRGLNPGINNNVTAYVSVNLASHKKAGQESYRTARRSWTLAGHVAQLKAQIKKLELARERDLRDGDTVAAEAKAAQMQALQEDVDTAAEKNKTRLVALDYTMETQNGSSFYNVTEQMEDTGEENQLKIKVVQEGRVKRTAETIGVVEVPLSRIKNSCCLNPLSGKKEYGLYMQKWQGFDPEAPGAHPPESEWGLPLSGSASARVWMVVRWSPCVEAVQEEVEGEEAATLVNALPSTIKPVQSAWQVK